MLCYLCTIHMAVKFIRSNNFVVCWVIYIQYAWRWNLLEVIVFWTSFEFDSSVLHLFEETDSCELHAEGFSCSMSQSCKSPAQVKLSQVSLTCKSFYINKQRMHSSGLIFLSKCIADYQKTCSLYMIQGIFFSFSFTDSTVVGYGSVSAAGGT